MSSSSSLGNETITEGPIMALPLFPKVLPSTSQKNHFTILSSLRGTVAPSRTACSQANVDKCKLDYGMCCLECI